MNFKPERLIELRKSLGINKAEAARRLNMSAMGYGRYENGDREPSYQTVGFIAQTFNTSIDYLYGISEKKVSDNIVLSKNDDPELFEFVKAIKDDTELRNRFIAYIKGLTST